jgi:hypothetical protein
MSGEGGREAGPGGTGIPVRQGLTALLAGTESLAKILATVALPLVLLVLGNRYTESQKDKDIGQRYVELAVEILAAPPTEGARELRSWAVATVNRYSEVKMSEGLTNSLVEREALPLQIRSAPREGFRPVEGTRSIERIIVSDTQQKNLDAELKILDDIGVSYHYLVTEEGAILGLVDENDIAHHTRGHNEDSIGIGVMHISGEEYSEAQIAALAQLIRDITARYGISAQNVIGKDATDPRRRSDFSKIAEKVLAN